MYRLIFARMFFYSLTGDATFYLVLSADHTHAMFELKLLKIY